MLASYLQSYFQDEELRHIFKDVVGTDKHERIQALIDKPILKHTESKISKILFIQSSIGVVFGFALENNKKVVLKVFSPKISLSYLERMNHIQAIFFKEGFPAPQVLSPIFTLGNTHAGIYNLIEGKNEDAHQPNIRLELAKHLAQFANIVEKHQLSPMENFFQQASHGKLWPIAHNILFNIKGSSQGAGWIAKKALAARKILTLSRLNKMLAHTDWGTKNAIFRNQKLKGIFDWDSLGAMSELEMIGRAASQFTADWESGVKVTPTPREGKLFLKGYEDFRGKKFSKDEYRIISAAADYHIAIIARFEHAGRNPMVHPYQDLLRECGKYSFLFAYGDSHKEYKSD